MWVESFASGDRRGIENQALRDGNGRRQMQISRLRLGMTGAEGS